MERLRDGLLKGKVRCAPYLHSAIIALPRFERRDTGRTSVAKYFSAGSKVIPLT